MVSNDDEVDTQFPNIDDSDTENTESFRVFTKHTIKELAAAENSDSDEFPNNCIDVQATWTHQDTQMIGEIW